MHDRMPQQSRSNLTVAATVAVAVVVGGSVNENNRQQGAVQTSSSASGARRPTSGGRQQQLVQVTRHEDGADDGVGVTRDECVNTPKMAVGQRNELVFAAVKEKGGEGGGGERIGGGKECRSVVSAGEEEEEEEDGDDRGPPPPPQGRVEGRHNKTKEEKEGEKFIQVQQSTEEEEEEALLSAAADPVAEEEEEEKEATPLPPPRKVRTSSRTTPLHVLVGCKKTHTDDDDDDDSEQQPKHTQTISTVTCKQLQQTQPASSADRKTSVSISSECNPVQERRASVFVVGSSHLTAVSNQCSGQKGYALSTSTSKSRFFVTMDDESMTATSRSAAAASQGATVTSPPAAAVQKCSLLEGDIKCEATANLKPVDDNVGGGGSGGDLDVEITSTCCINKDDIATVSNRPIATSQQSRRPLSWMQLTSTASRMLQQQQQTKEATATTLSKSFSVNRVEQVSSSSSSSVGAAESREMLTRLENERRSIRGSSGFLLQPVLVAADDQLMQMLERDMDNLLDHHHNRIDGGTLTPPLHQASKSGHDHQVNTTPTTADVANNNNNNNKKATPPHGQQAAAEQPFSQRSLSLPKSFLSNKYGLLGLKAALPRYCTCSAPS